ncbi:DUF2258 domain-containing protein [Candidatus Bathyarchaeota archaeon]|nr:MAG: DUF2258 domain-containing protein [Candidatus Bathyarchaeota archaeon]
MKHIYRFKLKVLFGGGYMPTKKVELRTGVIPAALYANKLRKVALAIFRDRVPRDIVLRDVAKLNQMLYRRLVEELKLSKGDFIRIMVKAAYDEEKGEIVFDEPNIERLVFESDVKKMYESKMKELEEKLRKLEEERDSYRKELETLKEKVREARRKIEEILNFQLSS